jgi:hypothetical protein
MSIYEHMTEFAGQPVVDWAPEAEADITGGVAYRLSVSWEEAQEGQQWTDKLAGFLSSLGLRRPAAQQPPPGTDPSWTGKLARFLDDPEARHVTGLVVGSWGWQITDSDTSVLVEPLVAARDRLPALRTLFLCDVTSEECEISWIHQSDISALFAAYPELEHFGVRGSENLSLGSLRHLRLKSLVIQSGGLPANVVREVAAAELPELEHLELWLGEEHYGGDSTVADLAPILTGSRFPKLRYLGLRDAEHADEIAAAAATALLTERIRVLDLSLGTLGDQGAMALLASPAVARLEKLDIHHHYCSEAMVEKLKALGIEVDAGDRKEPDKYRGERHRYVAVGE